MPRRRGVGVARQERHQRAGVGPDVRGIDAAVRADEPVRRLGDEHAVLHPDDAARLVEDDLDLARIAVVARGELDRLGAGDDAGQVDDGAFGLRHDLLGDDEHVVVGQRRGAGRPVDGVADDVAEVVADADLRDPVEGEDTDRRRVSRHRRPPSDRFDEDEVVGRVEVDRERPIDLDVRRAGGLGGGAMGDAGCPVRRRRR